MSSKRDASVFSFAVVSRMCCSVVTVTFAAAAAAAVAVAVAILHAIIEMRCEMFSLAAVVTERAHYCFCGKRNEKSRLVR